MLLLAPPLYAKLFPKLVHNIHPKCAPSYLYYKHMQVLQTRISIINTQNHRSRSPLQIVNVKPGNGGEGRIMMSGDAVKQPSEVYWGRKWKEFDMLAAGAMLALHVLCCFAPFTFNWAALKVTIGLDFLSRLLGINLSFHRHLSHYSFIIPKWLEYTFAYCGLHALQGNPIDWVSTHRYHHQYCDTDRDPHSPTKGFWFSHIIWLFDTKNIQKTRLEPDNVKDLEKQSFYRFLRRSYMAHPIALALLLYALGGFPFVVWGMGVRIVWGYHITWLVNSVCHGRGDQAWYTGDLSLNNAWVGVIGLGDGWHNNHHAFKYSARHGLEWWQIDITYYVIRLLEIIGLAAKVKLPTSIDIQRRTIHTNSIQSL
uniref:palmitoyl-monogalactosyldiacylglycerol delta-7 desaturase, chloroplastic-like n=1 Tax=Erigeron canadensis TaxID=72917 RepID=UPI001CB934B4|nr:palmitoyl-monogalactosyldiacylglycerol delta-7 desaturase, chloroplastic-like [Erigeron canadensis]